MNEPETHLADRRKRKGAAVGRWFRWHPRAESGNNSSGSPSPGEATARPGISEPVKNRLRFFRISWIAIATAGGLGIFALATAVRMAANVSQVDGANNSAAMYSLLDTGSALETEISRTVRPAMQRTEILAKNPDLIRALRAADPAAQTALLNSSISASTEIDAVALFDSTGQITAINTRYASGEPIPTERVTRVLTADFGQSKLNRSCLSNKSDGPVLEFQTHCRITRAFFDSTGLSVACSAPVIDPQTGEKLGVISSRLRFERLGKLVDQSIAGGAAKAYFVTDGGAYFSEEFNSGRARPPVPAGELLDVVRPLVADTTLRTVTKRDDKYLAAFSLPQMRTFDGGGIHIMIVADGRWLTLGPRQDRLVKAAVTGSVGALLLVVAALIYAQQIARRTIAARKSAEERMRHIALHDSLTGLANRALLMDRINRCIQSSREITGSLFAVIFFDLDRFKFVNDSLGHEAGDKLLIAISQRMETATRGTDTVSRVEPDQLARLGGDEFVVLLEKIGQPDDAALVCQRIQAALAQPYSINGQEVRSSASLGIAVSDGTYQSADEILRDADTALYAAKCGGRGNYKMFRPEMRASAVQRLWIEGALRQAIDRDELKLAYQPIVDLKTGRLIEVEALLRWETPDRGAIEPGDFISVADETGLIFPLGQWVLHEACRQMRQWQTAVPELSGVAVGVNISCRQFSRRNTLESARKILDETGLDPHLLKLEITETAVMDNVRPAIAELAALRDLGVQIHLDDFGTGYSSLGSLHQMPIEALKIDRSFVSAMGLNTIGTSIVQSIVALAHSLRMRVIAEGVENSTQLSELIRLGCDDAQGYHFARPMAPADLVAFVRDRATAARPAIAA